MHQTLLELTNVDHTVGPSLPAIAVTSPTVPLAFVDDATWPLHPTFAVDLSLVESTVILLSICPSLDASAMHNTLVELTFIDDTVRPNYLTIFQTTVMLHAKLFAKERYWLSIESYLTFWNSQLLRNIFKEV